MKQLIKDVILSFLIMCVLCAVFWQLGWIASAGEVLLLFKILILVIVIHQGVKWLDRVLKK